VRTAALGNIDSELHVLPSAVSC